MQGHRPGQAHRVNALILLYHALRLAQTKRSQSLMPLTSRRPLAAKKRAASGLATAQRSDIEAIHKARFLTEPSVGFLITGKD